LWCSVFLIQLLTLPGGLCRYAFVIRGASTGTESNKRKVPLIGIVSGLLGASGNLTLVAISSAFAGISEVGKGSPPFSG
jgi:hypothetical protein